MKNPNFWWILTKIGKGKNMTALLHYLWHVGSMWIVQQSSLEITQYVCKTQGHLSLEEGGMGENWSLRILEELELKLECADARAASLGWRSRTDGHCVPLTLSPIFQEMENHPLSSLCRLTKPLARIFKCTSSTTASIIIKERKLVFVWCLNFSFLKWKGISLKKRWS